MLCRLDVQVPDTYEEPLLGLAERFGIQAFSSPIIADAPGGEENFRFTGETTVSFLISTIEQRPEQIETALREFLQAEKLTTTISRVEYSDNEDWMKVFKSSFTPFRVGRSIVIRPPWSDPLPGEKKGVTILIEPGMAFGTGTHETTRLCLKLLGNIDPKGGAFLDIGAGSGILSIYLLKKGARRIEAVEIDGPAVENLRLNYQLNGTMPGLLIHRLDLIDFTPIESVDGLIANITSPVLLDNFHRFWIWLNPGGWAIFSGINSANAPSIKAALQENGFTVIKRIKEGEWHAFLTKKN